MKKIATTFALLCSFMFFAQNYNPIINYSFNGTPANGIKIKTNIPFKNGQGMPTVIIEGYQYGGRAPIGLILNWYVYGDDFYYPVASSFGAYTPEIKLSKENDKVVIFINDKQYYNRFTIRGYAVGQSETAEMFSNWSISDELLTGSVVKSFVYKSKFAGAVELDGKLSIGNNNSKALMDVSTFVPNGTLGSVFGRLAEGNTVGDGTYLGVKGHKTQGPDVDNIKSFSLVHNFYGKTNNSINFYRGRGINGGFIAFNTSNDIERMRITPEGNVAIGTNDAKGYKLAVAGGKGIIAEEIKVKLHVNWPDYVFTKDYELPSLNDLEKYIIEKGHLPNVPSAKKVKEDEGVELGVMNAKLLEKIEELTLYTIQQGKDIKKRELENQKLKLALKKIEKRLTRLEE
ncbi:MULTISPECIES: hypothetical protein [unclassified Tenacibaculum]|uniref:hypothetical protein n=1 Tax=unclassified Tenacibaculum TaxID=2635139 RepID=UPI001F2A429C|nr:MULTISPECIES: hypothetical protein [unclassified Tenacibaculum]MCF2875356.1 hypothetical protein [Tenacibaculum sp. Cn5-1]MCF2935432.1 hypothetical protein [Tenacibaculum sp. Cn5-34]MCG7511992.1 hypothetical protein [Tenacibaculum sp. Cn5-46]